MKSHALRGVAAILGLAGGVASAHAVETTAYGSLRLGAEAVSPDNNAGSFDSYTDIRDAYTRLGVKITEKLNDDWSVMGQLEVPVDLANMASHSPYDDSDDIRIAKLQISGPAGTLWFGRGWMAFYNNIAYPVDYFSSYYSGWATLTTFRRENTIYYASPRVAGLKVDVASTEDNGGSTDRRNQFVLSYANGGLSLAVGRDDTGGDGFAINGVSGSYSTGPWYVGAKYEVLDDANSASDGEHAANLLLQYKLDAKNTVRGMVADVSAWDYGNNIFHLGWDHQYSDNLKVFAEYYQEETTAAISDAKTSTLGSGDFFSAADSGGQVFTVGMRYDFSN